MEGDCGAECLLRLRSEKSNATCTPLGRRRGRREGEGQGEGQGQGSASKDVRWKRNRQRARLVTKRKAMHMGAHSWGEKATLELCD